MRIPVIYGGEYVKGKHLYRLDLRTQKLEQLGQQNFELAELTSRQAQYMDVDAAGHLYLPGHNQIYKILIPQPEGR